MQNIILNARLSAAASLTGEGSVADIGTDHAFLPIFLVNRGTPRALASDINEGPCERAALNVGAYGLADRITVACRAGLDGIESFAPDNIIIAGMGGELIASILEASDYPKNSRCRLILQPMTMQAELRRYLANGFNITEELVVREDHPSGYKHYQLIAASWDGIKREYSETEYRLGKINLARIAKAPTEADLTWLDFIKKSAKARIRGRECAAIIDSHEQELDKAMLAEIESLHKEIQ